MLAMVLDVSSCGLYGEAFAFAYVVVRIENGSDFERVAEGGGTLLRGAWASRGLAKDFEWAREHVFPAIRTGPMLEKYTSSAALRTAFWVVWRAWERQGASLWAEQGAPAISNFLSACVDDNPVERSKFGPRPLHEMGTLMALLGADPLGAEARLQDLGETPRNHPLCEARLTARKLDGLIRTVWESGADTLFGGRSDLKAKPEEESTVGHHINAAGQFHSEKFPSLPPDYVAINMTHPHNWPLVIALAETYRYKKPEFSRDLLTRLNAIRVFVEETDMLTKEQGS